MHIGILVPVFRRKSTVYAVKIGKNSQKQYE
jgi:hypothetical protein